MKYIKLFEQHNEKNNKDSIINEFERIISINHSIEGSLHEALSSIYDKGFEIGQLQKVLGFDFSKNSKSNIRISNVISGVMKNIKSKRIGNERNIKYNSQEITANKILASDLDVQQTLDEMADPEADYMYFKSNDANEDNYKKRLERAYDEEERDSIEYEYNNLEVEILLMKCYQVGFSEGMKSARPMPREIARIFDIQNDLNDPNSFRGDDSIRKSMSDYLDTLKQEYPEWEKYKEYYN